MLPLHTDRSYQFFISTSKNFIRIIVLFFFVFFFLKNASHVAGWNTIWCQEKSSWHYKKCMKKLHRICNSLLKNYMLKKFILKMQCVYQTSEKYQNGLHISGHIIELSHSLVIPDGKLSFRIRKNSKYCISSKTYTFYRWKNFACKNVRFSISQKSINVYDVHIHFSCSYGFHFRVVVLKNLPPCNIGSCNST